MRCDKNFVSLARAEGERAGLFEKWQFNPNSKLSLGSLARAPRAWVSRSAACFSCETARPMRL